VTLATCPHCGHSLTAKDVEADWCWYCEKKMTRPIEPKPKAPPFIITFLFGFVGAVVGLAFGIAFTGRSGTWTTSFLGGIGYATGHAIAGFLYRDKKPEEA
jgi:hypothetical protein